MIEGHNDIELDFNTNKYIKKRTVDNLNTHKEKGNEEQQIE